ncbi:ABC transporter permease [Exiguobacterium sp. KRL4]|uniref:ABC transporter permease n=1 Tax=Exiguobacterium sp. KRL4 TaxID=1914536 RepID=UPI0008F8BA1F|nr:ABC transporter permease [Exiguobacterium sp. KRL4]OIN68191.1 ABC transporter permease [Exiguobacterium sp. KRL4]
MWRGNAWPATLLIAGMVGYGLFVSLSMTTWTDYRQLLSDSVFLESIGLSLYVAVSSTSLSVMIGALLAAFFAKQTGWAAQLLAIPLFIPHLGAAYLSLLYLSDLPVIGPHEGNHFSIILTYLYKEIPFVFFYLLPVYRRLDHRYEELGLMLGLSRLRRFWHGKGVFLLFPVLEAAFIVFAFTLFAYEVPALLGVTYPKMIGVYAFDLYTQGDLSSQPTAFAISVVLTGMLFVLLLLFTRLIRPLTDRISKGRSE